MKFKSIKSFNQYCHAKPPKHKEIDLGEYSDDFLTSSPPIYPDFYRISLKYGYEGEGGKGYMYFSSPNQSIEWENVTSLSGYYINITEDLISNHQHLNYSFLTYGMHEPLFLSQQEEDILSHLFREALKEYQKEDFSIEILVGYCNLMFAYVAKFYKRQFGQKKEDYSILINDFFHLLNSYYKREEVKTSVEQPSVHYFAKKLNVTPNYLSDVIRSHTGKSALDHIHKHIVETAKKLLITEKGSISEIAYQLGFEYPNYFSRLFRKITNVSPSAYRKQ